MKLKLLLLVILMSTNFAISQNKALWQKQTIDNNRVKPSKQDLPRTQTFALNSQTLRQALVNAPARSNRSIVSNVVLSFPNAEGEFERFRIYEASVMHPDLAARYPGIKSYAGKGVDDPTAVIRFSMSHLGFQSMRLSGNKPATFIEALNDDASVYSVFTRANRIDLNDNFECTVNESITKTMNSSNSALRNADDSLLRTYRLAVSASGGYTQFHGVTVADALAAINTTMTRVNGIFEVDFSVRLLLIANTDQVIYTDPGTDPYGGGSLNNQLQTTLTSIIGEANYDIGHLFATEGGNSGNAGCIGCVCVNNQKGSGWTSRTNPVGDFFDVDYVAHEMGHQFGANHTWTHAGNEGTGVQAEPGSGTTIMSYAGITGANTDVEPNVTPNFHALSIEQVTNYIQNPLCEIAIATGNVAPVVNAGPNYTIPRGTPFILEGSATDADTDAIDLTYVWEQIDDSGSSTTKPSTTQTVGPAFRNYEPDANTDRYFPRLETIKTGATSWEWEAVPDVARDLNFRLTVRDNELNGGGNSSDDVNLSVNGTAGPFVVNSPNTNVTWNEGAFATVTWDVAGTTGNGVNAANVDIFLSTDGGDTYPIPLAAGVANDGSHDIIVPNNQGTQNRVMVRGANHIFFDISDADFTIAAPISCTASVPTGFASSNVGATTATLSWGAISAAIFDIQYRVVGSGTWIDVSTSNTPFDLTDLTPESDYEAQIRSRCPDNSTSAYSSIINFTTTALPPCVGTQITSYPYLETFDSGLGDWAQGSGDDGDWILDAGGTPSGNTGPSDDVTGGGNYLFLEASSNGSPGEIGANAIAVFESPCFDLNGETEATLSFFYHMFGVDAGTIDVEVSNDNGISWTNIFSISGNQGDIWNSTNIDLVAYLNQNIKLRITGTTGNGFASDIAIDQIGIGAPVADTIAPVITLNGASTLNLTLGDTYTELGATAVDNVDGDLTSSIVVGGDTVDTNTVGTYVVTYNVSDAAGNAAVEVTRTVIVSEYCAASGNLDFQTAVTRVIFGSIDNVDGPPKDVGYEDFTNISTDVTQGTTVDLTVQVDTDGNFVVHAFVWIDWNQDDDFDDSGEVYDLGDIQGVADGALPTLPILIPANAQLGSTRMRVSARYNTDPTPCLTDFDGEVEDYTVNVLASGVDTEAPVITLNGASTVSLILGDTYTELGATAVDNVDGDLTSSIVIGGDTVDTNTVGTYVVTYNVSDAAGNAAVEVTRTVIVSEYCASSGNLDFQTAVTRVVFGTIDNIDGPPKDVGYEDFTNISTDVTQGTNVDLTVQVDTDGNFVVHTFVWIDWNMDGDFDDAGEEYDLGDILNVEDGALPTLSVVIPESMNFGMTRMRVSAKFGSDPNSCETNFDGEVEDYTVNVKYDGLLFSGGTWDPIAPNGSTSTDNVLVLDGTFNSTSDMSINDLTVNSNATMSIGPTNNLTVGGNIDIMSNGDLILNSTSTVFSSLLVDGSVTGTVKYNRHVTDNDGGNDLIAPPVSGEIFTSFIGNNSNIFANTGETLYLFGPFEKPLNDYTVFSNTETTTLDAGTGYRAASTDNGTFTFEGAVTNTTLSIPLVYSGVEYAKWNLVGNPYTSYIRLDEFLMANLNELDPNTVAVYGYDADITFGTEWTIWNMAYSDNNPGSLIAPGQGFFVSSKDDGTSNVIFTPSMRSTGTSDDFIAGRNSDLAHFIINMSRADKTYNTDIYFEDNATLGLDIGYDAALFEEEPSSFSIYTELTEAGENLNMAIQTIGYDDVNGSTLIPLGINLLEGQQVTISMDTSDTQYDVYLEDTLANTVTLLNTSDFSLTADSDMIGTGRFYLRFETETLSVSNTSLEEVEVFSDATEKQIVIKGQLNQDTEFVLYDIQGREMIRTDLDISNNLNTVNTANFANGVYLVQLLNSTNTFSKKLIIK